MKETIRKKHVLFRKQEQAQGQFNSGEILENKPIGFPHEGGRLKPYSNLFYWAHAYTAGRESTIGLHPHKGFEIMSIVLKGSIEHYDTKMKKWIRLEEGDVQLIQAGSGISHSEKLNPHSEMFQIWFDPGLQKSLRKEASYRDFRKDEFDVRSYPGRKEVVIRDEHHTLGMDSPVRIRKIVLDAGKHQVKVESGFYASIYLVEGQVHIADAALNPDDFLLMEDPEFLWIENKTPSTFFLLENPLDPGYPTYYNFFKPD